MNQFLLVVDIPVSPGSTFPPSSAGNEWRTFESRLKSIGLPTKGCARASRNVWRIDAENALPALLALIGLAQFSCESSADVTRSISS